MEHAQEYEAWVAAALQETERRTDALRRGQAMWGEPRRDEAIEGEGDTGGAEYLAEDDRTKTIGYNAVPHHAQQPSRERQVARVRREAGQRPPKTTRADEAE